MEDSTKTSSLEKPQEELEDSTKTSSLEKPQEELEDLTKTSFLEKPQEELEDLTKTSFLEKPQEELEDPTKTSFLEKPQEELEDPTKTSFLEKPQEELKDSNKSSTPDKGQEKPEDSKNASYLEEILKKKTNQQTKKDGKSKKKVRTRSFWGEDVNRLGILGRFYALFFEIIISTVIYIVFIIPKELSFLFLPGRDIVHSLLDEYQIPYRELIVQEALDVFFIYILLNVLSSLCFSATFGQRIMNVRTKGNFIFARIKAVLRFSIGLVTGPCFIFDIPAMFGWPTFKEILTFSKVGYESNFMKFLGMILLPIITLFIFLVPVMNYYHTLTKHQYMKVSTYTSKSSQKDVPHQIFSLHHLTIKVKLRNDEQLLPYFDNKDDEVGPQIMFLNMKEKQRIFYGSASFINLFELGLERIIRVDTFFPKKFPFIYAYYQSKKGKESETASIDQKQYIKELSLLYKSILSLNLEKVPEFYMTTSPFIGPYLAFKKNIMMNVFSSTQGSIKEFTIGDITFFQYENSNNGVYKVFHISENFDQDIVWRSSFKEKDKAFYRKFILRFIKEGMPASLHTGHQVPKDKFGTFDMIDFFYRMSKYEHSTEYYRMVFEFYKQRVDEIGDNEYYKQALKDSIQSLIDAISNHYSELENLSSRQKSDLIDLMKNLDVLISKEALSNSPIETEKEKQEASAEN